ARGARQLDLTVATRPEVGDLARTRFALHDMELVARLRRAGETQHLDRESRSRALDSLGAIVDETTHAAPYGAGHQHVAHLERAALDQHRRHRTAALVEPGLDHHAVGGAVGIGLELEHF